MKKYFSPVVLSRVFVVAISIFWISLFWVNYQDGIFKFWGAIKDTGSLAWGLLVFTIFVSLLQKITRQIFPKIWLFSSLLPLRKSAGIFAFLIILSHGALEIVRKGFGTNIGEILKTALSTEHSIIFGSISFLIMFPVFLTSTSWAIKKMGYKSWKFLQRFTHLAFVFAALHIALLNYFGKGLVDSSAIAILLLYFGGYVYLFITKKKVS